MQKPKLIYKMYVNKLDLLILVKYMIYGMVVRSCQNKDQIYASK